MKKFTLLLALLFVFSTCVAMPAYAAGDSPVDVHGVLNLTDVESNPDITVSEVMTFTEMVEHYAMSAGITYEEALLAFPNQANTRATMDIFYRVFSQTLNVTSVYKPQLEFYCETAEGGNFRNINSIYSVQLVRSYNGISKQYSGDIEVWLRSTYAIEYTVNGDFYNNGTTTISGGANLQIGLDEIGKLTFTVSGSYQNNHYAYF